MVQLFVLMQKVLYWQSCLPRSWIFIIRIQLILLSCSELGTMNPIYATVRILSFPLPVRPSHRARSLSPAYHRIWRMHQLFQTSIMCHWRRNGSTPEFKPYQPPQETESLNPSFYQLSTRATKYLMKDVHNLPGKEKIHSYRNGGEGKPIWINRRHALGIQ